MNPHPTNPDARIDHVLDALRSTQPTPGLEARVAAHLAAHAEARRLALNSVASAKPAPFFALILNAVKDPCIFSAEARLYAFAATTLTLLLTLSVALHLHHNPQTLAQWNPIHATTAQPAPAPIPPTPFEGAGLQSRDNPHPTNTALAAEAPQQPTDPDTIALAETLAPSHPAPPMPLTAQEALLVRATRQGQPIELAERSIARESNLRTIADAHEHSSLRQYIEGLLRPLAAAQAFESPSADATQTTTSDPTPPPSSK